MDLRNRVENLEEKVQWLARGDVIHVNGSVALERLYKKTVETTEGGGYELFRRLSGPTLVEEVAKFLG